MLVSKLVYKLVSKLEISSYVTPYLKVKVWEATSEGIVVKLFKQQCHKIRKISLVFSLR